MQTRDEKIGDVIKVSVAGKLEAATVGEFKDKIKSLSENSGLKFVIDLKEVEFVDSSGLGGLVASFRAVGAKGGDMKIAGLTPEVRQVFELTRLHRVFEVFEDSEAAVKSFSA